MINSSVNKGSAPKCKGIDGMPLKETNKIFNTKKSRSINYKQREMEDICPEVLEEDSIDLF